jgi:hypothetical protein
MMTVLLYIIASLLCCLATTTDAYAYIDPGTGSILLQSIIGALAVGAAFVAGFWQKIRSFFARFETRTSAKHFTVEKPSDDSSQK